MTHEAWLNPTPAMLELILAAPKDVAEWEEISEALDLATDDLRAIFRDAMVLGEYRWAFQAWFAAFCAVLSNPRGLS